MRPYLRASMWRPTSRASTNWRDQVGLDRLAEELGRRVDDRLAVDDAGVVDQHVDAAMPADEGLDLLAHRRLVGDVERHDLRPCRPCGRWPAPWPPAPSPCGRRRAPWRRLRPGSSAMSRPSPRDAPVSSTTRFFIENRSAMSSPVLPWGPILAYERHRRDIGERRHGEIGQSGDRDGLGDGAGRRVRGRPGGPRLERRHQLHQEQEGSRRDLCRREGQGRRGHPGAGRCRPGCRLQEARRRDDEEVGPHRRADQQRRHHQVPEPGRPRRRDARRISTASCGSTSPVPT